MSWALSLTSSNVYVFTIFPLWKTVCSRSWRGGVKQEGGARRSRYTEWKVTREGMRGRAKGGGNRRCEGERGKKPQCWRDLFICVKTQKHWCAQKCLCATGGIELTTPNSSRSPLPSSRVTKSPLGVRCRDRRPFFDLLLGSATGSLNTFNCSSRTGKKTR